MAYPSPDPTGSDSTSPPPEPGPPLDTSDVPLAFEAMVRQHYGRLCAFAFRLMGSRELAEDVVHDVLLRVWRDRERFEFRDPLAYLYRAVRNQIISEHRRSDARSRLLEEHPDADVLSTEAPDAAAVVEHDDFAQAAARAVASLPERCRLVYTMRREQGLSYAEIARVLDVTVKTVENQMTRAAKLLRVQLASYLSVVLAVTSTASVMWRRIGS